MPTDPIERGPHGGRMVLGQELCPTCDCCSLDYVECENCGGEGLTSHDCGEDTCCCAYPEDNVECDYCNGAGNFFTCLGGCHDGVKHGAITHV